MEVARRLAGNTTLSAGLAVSAYTPVSVLPEPTERGSVYQRLIAPELSYYATRVVTRTATLGLRRRLGTGLAIAASIESNRIARRSGDPPVPFQPSGTRSGWSAGLGFIVVSRSSATGQERRRAVASGSSHIRTRTAPSS